MSLSKSIYEEGDQRFLNLYDLSRNINDKIFMLDGGLASSLQADGIQVDGNPLWSAHILHSIPDAIYRVHTEFLKSGSEILITASYQASIQGFQNHLGLSKNDSLDLIKRSVYIAQKARTNYEKKIPGRCGPIFIGGSVGPYGACLADGSEYTGSYISLISDTELMEWHKSRIEALISSGVDFLAIETIPALKEALAILKLLKNYPTIKAWVTFSCKDSQHTSYGDKFGEAVHSCLEENSDQLIGIGVNCTCPSLISPLLKEASKTIPETFPKIVYPNSGEIWDSSSGWKGSSIDIVDTVKSELSTWMQLGVKVIGGCCRVLPSDIQQLSDHVNK